MNLIISGKLIDPNISIILDDIQRITHGMYFERRKSAGDFLMVSCPSHKNGQEKHPSCGICCTSANDQYSFGYFHCFTCGFTGELPDLVSFCLDITRTEACQWLVSRYSNTYIVSDLDLPEIDLSYHKDEQDKQEYLDESILDNFNYMHPYMFERKLTPEVISKFKIGFDPKCNSITFPMWDENGNLIAINKRRVDRKQYDLQANRFKGVYLLNFVLKEHINTLYICESQINALTLWTYGLPAVALCGTGSKKQLEILKNCGIKNYILCFDGDDAGDQGRDKFLEYMPENFLCSYVIMPRGKDVNDLSKEEFMSLKIV